MASLGPPSVGLPPAAVMSFLGPSLRGSQYLSEAYKALVWRRRQSLRLC